MKKQFPLKHFVNQKTKEVYVICESAITAMGISAFVKKYYPGYKGQIISQEHLDKLAHNIPKGT